MNCAMGPIEAFLLRADLEEYVTLAVLSFKAVVGFTPRSTRSGEFSDPRGTDRNG